MTDVRIDVDDFARAADALDELGEIADRPLEDALEESGDDVQRAVRRRARRHRRSGHLERSVTTRRRGRGRDSQVNVHVGAPYAGLIVRGTRSHEIRPLERRALSIAGAVGRFASVVRHPGTQADPFFARGVDDAIGAIDDNLGRAGDRIVDELGDRMEG